MADSVALDDQDSGDDATGVGYFPFKPYCRDCGRDTTTVTASGYRVCERVIPTVSVPSPQTCRIALVTSSDVMATASSVNSSSPWKPSAARTWKRAIRTDSGMLSSMNVISRGSVSIAVLAMAWFPSALAWWQLAPAGHAIGRQKESHGKWRTRLANLAA